MFKKFILFVILFSMLGGAALAFKDLPSIHWASPSVTRLVEEYKVISGYPDNTFRGEKILNRYEFAKALVSALNYIETTCGASLKTTTTKGVAFKDVKKTYWAYSFVMDLVLEYQIVSGYPDRTFRGKNELNRYQVSVAMANALSRVEKASGSTVKAKAIVPSDVASDHWAYSSVQKLMSAGIISAYKDGAFKGQEPVSRYSLAAILVKFIDFSTQRLKKKIVEVPPSRVARALQIAAKPWATVSGGWGNIYESGSGTNNWMGLDASASYGDVFSIWRLSGNYEITGKYGFNQINYMVPAGAGVNGGIVDENRYELELNTIHPVIKFYGISGKLLVGMKYVNLSNSTAPCDFTGLNVGVATSATVFERELLTRAFYSLPLAQVNVTPSVLGQPSHLFDYEASMDAVMFSYPVLFGFGGEVMTLSGGAARYYNAFFVRYFLL